MIQTNSRFQPSLKFQGAYATKKAEQGEGKKPLSQERMAEVLREDVAAGGDSFVGQVPEEMVAHPVRGEQHVKDGLQKLANILQKLSFPPTKHTKVYLNCAQIRALEYGLGSGVKVSSLGRGASGDVYLLKANDQKFAFKIFKPTSSFPADIDVTLTPFQEAANGAFFNARQTSDVSRLHLAKLNLEAPLKGWQLMEYIGSKAKLADRAGATMQEQGLALSDDRDDNYVNGIRVDYGGEVYPHDPVSRL